MTPWTCQLHAPQQPFNFALPTRLPLDLSCRPPFWAGSYGVFAQCGSGEMANTLALGASAARLRGSSPLFRTKIKTKGLDTGQPEQRLARFL